MGDQAIVGSLEINVDRVEGDIGGGEQTNQILEDILSELKNINTAQQKSSKLGLSGVFGKGGGDSGGGGLLGAGAGFVAGKGLPPGLGPLGSLLALITAAQGTLGAAELSGDKLEEVNEHVDSIKKSLGIQADDNKSVVDVAKKILKRMGVTETLVDKILDPLGEFLDVITGSVEIAKKLFTKQDEERSIQSEIVELQKKKREALVQELSNSGFVDSSDLTLLDRFERAGSGFRDIARQQTVTSEEASNRARFDQATFNDIYRGENILSSILQENNRVSPPQSKIGFDLSNIYNLEGLQ